MDILQFHGLSHQVAQKKLLLEGYNELPSQKKLTWVSMLIHILSEPMLILLVFSGAIYLLMGEPKDAIMLVFTIFVVVGITFYQERKTEKTLESLKNLSSPRALVIRDGKQLRIPGREVVREDFVIIREGDRIPADGTILSCENLSIDESLVTGESTSVRKRVWDETATQTRPGGDDLPFVYSGSMVVSGRGIFKVTSIGSQTEIGKIGKSLESIKVEDTLLHKETEKIVRTISIIGFFLCLFVFLTYYLTKGDALHGLLSGLTLSMAILPEEYPVVLLIFMTLGAWRISKYKVLTRRPAAIETLGAATVLCTDKTGTLTLNKMKLTCLYSKDTFHEISGFASSDLPEKFHRLLEYGVLSSVRDPFDPIEKELHKIASLYLNDAEYLREGWNIIKEYPLTKELLALSHVWESPDKKKTIIATKGAPEAIFDLCQIASHERDGLIKRVEEMTNRGLRVLGVAEATPGSGLLPNNQQEFNFKFVGLLGFIDPPRSAASDAVRDAYTAGMQVIMITGDYPGTAVYIAKEIGIKNPYHFITGEELNSMSPLELSQKIRIINIFARVLPEQKLLIVNALKANNEIVAMTGDGVNDAPALKSAHIGIAMGDRGTDVAREASSLVLLKDDFSSIVTAVRLGRRIFDNLKRAMGYILAVHVPIVGMSIIPLLLDSPAILLPAHIAFMELVIDPACSTVFESQKEDDQIMKRPPRKLNQPMFTLKTIFVNLLQGASILAVILAIFFVSRKIGRAENEVRSLVFASLIVSNLILIMTNLSWKENIFTILSKPNKALTIVVMGAIFGLMSVIYIPFFADLFRMSRLNLIDWAIVTAGATIALFWFELLKFIQNTRSFRTKFRLD